MFKHLMTEQMIDKGAQVTTFAGSAVSITVWGLDISDLGVIVSATVAVCGLVVHVWYTLRKDRRAQQAHERAMWGRNGAAPTDEERT